MLRKLLGRRGSLAIGRRPRNRTISPESRMAKLGKVVKTARGNVNASIVLSGGRNLTLHFSPRDKSRGFFELFEISEVVKQRGRPTMVNYKSGTPEFKKLYEMHEIKNLIHEGNIHASLQKAKSI